jgi:hypothetical protein
MRGRCSNKNNPMFMYYGERGIKVCERWDSSYENFLLDMGRAPSPKHSIDRINVNGDYEPGNCRWATDKEQSNNKRTSRILSYNGVKKTIAQWAELSGVSAGTIGYAARTGRTLGYVFNKYHVQLLWD